jgi:hypothetical protein
MGRRVRLAMVGFLTTAGAAASAAESGLDAPAGWAGAVICATLWRTRAAGPRSPRRAVEGVS